MEIPTPLCLSNFDAVLAAEVKQKEEREKNNAIVNDLDLFYCKENLCLFLKFFSYLFSVCGHLKTSA